MRLSWIADGNKKRQTQDKGRERGNGALESKLRRGWLTDPFSGSRRGKFLPG
jgi:hypothetical protein